MLGKILKFRLNHCLSFLPIHILKLEISGCDTHLWGEGGTTAGERVRTRGERGLGERPAARPLARARARCCRRTSWWPRPQELWCWVALQDPRPPTSPPSSQCRPSQRRLRASSPQRLLAPSALPLLCRVARLRQRSWVEAACSYSSGEEGAGGGASN
jgi:hypothetical protein